MSFQKEMFGHIQVYKMKLLNVIFLWNNLLQDSETLERGRTSLCKLYLDCLYRRQEVFAVFNGQLQP